MSVVEIGDFGYIKPGSKVQKGSKSVIPGQEKPALPGDVWVRDQSLPASPKTDLYKLTPDFDPQKADKSSKSDKTKKQPDVSFKDFPVGKPVPTIEAPRVIFEEGESPTEPSTKEPEKADATLKETLAAITRQIEVAKKESEAQRNSTREKIVEEMRQTTGKANAWHIPSKTPQKVPAEIGTVKPANPLLGGLHSKTNIGTGAAFLANEAQPIRHQGSWDSYKTVLKQHNERIQEQRRREAETQARHGGMMGGMLSSMSLMGLGSMYGEPTAPMPPLLPMSQALKNWGNRNRSHLGVLLTPPMGSVRPEVKDTQNYVSEIVEKLAGPKLRERGMNVKVNLYSGDALNAFAARHDDNWKQRGEVSEKVAERNATLATLRPLLDPEKKGGPIYELGISAGTLRKLNSEHELAFILAHEIAHLLENHTEPETRSWLKSQAHEVVADSEGLRMMTEAGYDPAKGIKLLERLHEGQEQPELKDLFKAATYAGSSHHHEGVRVAAAQLRTEHLRRTVKNNLPQQQDKLIPKRMKLSVAPDTGAPQNSNLNDVMKSLAQDFLKQDLEARFGSPPKPKDSEALEKLYQEDWSPAEAGVAYGNSLETIDSSELSPQDKVDTALLMLFKLSDHGWNRGGPPEVKPTQLGRFLTKYAKSGQWDPAKFEAKLNYKKEGAYASGDTEFHQDFTIKVMMSPHFQKVAERLHQTSDVWQELYSKAPAWAEKDSLGVGDSANKVLGYLSGRKGEGYGDKWPKDSEPGKGPLDEVLRSHFVEHFREKTDAGKLNNVYQIVSLRSQLEPEQSFASRIEEVIQPAVQHLAEKRTKELSSAFTTRDATEKLFDSARALPIDDGEYEILKKKFVETERPAKPYQGSYELNRFLGRVLCDESVDLETQAKAFKTFLECPSIGGLPSETSPGMSDFYQFLESKSSEKLLAEIKNEAGSGPVGNFKRPPDRSNSGFGMGMGMNLSSMSRMFGEAPARFEVHQNPLMSAIGKRRDLSKLVARKMTLDDLDKMLNGSQDRNLELGTRLFMLDSLLAASGEKPEPKAFQKRLEQITLDSFRLFDGRPELRTKISEVISPELAQLEASELTEKLKDRKISEILSPDHTAALMSQLLPPQKGDSPESLKARLDDLDKTFELRDKPALRKAVHGKLAEIHKVQPQDMKVVFPEDDRSITRQMDSLTGQIRGLSGLVAVTRGKPPEQQIQMVEYLMGRKAEKPEFLEQLDDEVKEKTRDSISASMLVEEARSSLANADQAVRTAVGASFVAGPSGILKDPEGRKQLVEHFIEPVSEKRKDIARNMASVLLDSQGSQDALAVGYLLGLPSKGGEEGLSEGAVLNSLFDAYGTPGVKLKQYLAFTSEFAEFKDHFEESQDNAMPLNYLDAVKLADHHFGDKWPPDWKFEEILGSGSVNVAVKFLDQKTGEHRVVSLPRRDVEINSDYDFYRMDKFIDGLLETEENKERFGYLKGLVSIIQDSVGLEFDRKAAFEMQNSVQDFYNRKVGDWTVKTVKAYGMVGDAIEMEEAKGKTARKVLNSNPDAYKKGMSILAQVERDALYGMADEKNPNPEKMHANPDFHDGQVLIDEESKTVTILDFGQAVTISNEQREYAADLLTMVGGGYSTRDAAALLKENSGVELDHDKLDSVLKAGDRMDVFVKLLGTMAGEGSKVPMPAVHWVLGMNRQRALGEKVGTPIDNSLKMMALVRKTGGDVAAFNALRIATRTPSQVLRGGIWGPLGGWIENAVGGMLGSGSRSDKP